MSTCPSRVSAARARAATVAGSVTSPGTAQAWRPAARSSVANASIPLLVRATTMTAAPAPASARATAIPIPGPHPSLRPPVRTASPGKLREHRLCEDRSEDLDRAHALVGPGVGGRPKVRPGPARFLEARLAGADCRAERAGVGGQRPADRVADQLRTRRQHDGALVPPRVAGAAPELLGESQGPGPLGDVGKHDLGAVLALVLGHGGLEGGDVRRV